MLRMFRRVPMALSAGAIAVALAFDPYLPSVSTLLHGGTTSNITDDVGNTITNAGVVSYSMKTANSAYMNGSSYAKSSSTDYNFGTSDFTIEFLINPIGNSGRIINCWKSNNDSGAWAITLLNQNGGVGLYVELDSTGVVPWDYSGSFPSILKQNEWQHVAIVRSGSGSNNFTIYVNGVSVATFTYSGSVGGGDMLWMGGRPSNPAGTLLEASNIGLANVRLTKTARYLTNFTPNYLPAFDNSDPNWNNTVLAMNFVDGIVDLKSHSFINSGVEKLTDNTLMPHASMLYFNGSGAKLTYPASSMFDLSSGTFTIEWWMNPSVMPTAGNQCRLFMFGANATSTAFDIGLNNNGSMVAAVPNSGVTVLTTPANTFTAGVWQHFALNVSNGVATWYKNGVKVISGTITVPTTSSPVLNIGFDTVGTVNFNYKGLLAEARITKGIARYPADFTLPTNAFSDYRTADYYWDNTVLLMNGESLTDARGVSFTNNNGVTTSTSEKKFDASSIHFNSANWLSAASNLERFNFGTFDFTMEGWVKCESVINNPAIFDTWKTGNSATYQLYISSANKLVWYSGSSAIVTSTINVPLNTWTHVAVSRAGTTVYLFINGVLAGTGTDTNNYNGATHFVIGRQEITAGDFFPGYMDELRVTRGVARYKTPFSVQVAGYPNYGTNGPINDVYWKYNNLVMDGSSLTDKSDYARTFVANSNAAVSTAQAKIGNKSLYIPTSGYLNGGSNSNMLLGTSDFTIDAWVYPTQASAEYGMTIASTYSSTPTDNGWSLSINRANVSSAAAIHFGMTANGTGQAVKYTGPNLAINTWHHVVVERKNGVVYIFLNGVQVANGTMTINDTYVGIFQIGGGNTSILGDPTSAFTGYINTLRISKGINRYYPPFIVPTYAMALK